jgi:hypothetical protein
MTKIKYTETASNKLDELQLRYKEELENILISKKLIPGDDFVEVTASDIDEVSKYFKYIRPVRNTSKYLLLIIYFAIGLISTVMGLFYDDLRYIIENRPTQAMIILVGLTFMLVSFVSFFFFRIRDNQRESFDKHKRDIEFIEFNIKDKNKINL